MSESRTGFSYGGGMNVPSSRGISGTPSSPHHGSNPPSSIAKPPPKVIDEPIELVADEAATPGHSKTIRSFGVAESKHKDTDWKRKPYVGNTGAVRMRSFHGRLSEQGLEYLDNSINEWLDAHPDIEIKFVTSTEGMFEGKIKEPALILNIWY